jgi:hypothetical protein
MFSIPAGYELEFAVTVIVTLVGIAAAAYGYVKDILKEGKS